MKLYLMRHCAAEEGPVMDDERSLDPLGQQQAHIMRKFLKRAAVHPDVIICSDFARAEDTAKIMQRGDTPLLTTPWLRPMNAPLDSDIVNAWNSILRLSKESKAVLVVTHGPLIQPLLASVAFNFIDEQWNFEHGSIAYVNTHESRFRWFVTPKLAAHITGEDPGDVENPVEAVEIARAALALAENLMSEARAGVIGPLRAQMHTALSARWKKQLARGKRALRKNTAADPVSAAAVLASVLPFRDKTFAKHHRAVKHAAYRAGVQHTAGQLGLDVEGAVEGIEARRPKVNIPAPHGDTIDDQGYNLERELDRTTVDRAHNAIAALAEPYTTAAATGALNDLFHGFTAPGSGKLSRADTVALQTVSDGYHSGGRDLVSNAADAGIDTEKRWETESGDPCATCLDNEAEDWIPADSPHDSGDFEPPAHPNCACSEVYRVAEPS